MKIIPIYTDQLTGNDSLRSPSPFSNPCKCKHG